MEQLNDSLGQRLCFHNKPLTRQNVRIEHIVWNLWLNSWAQYNGTTWHYHRSFSSVLGYNGRPNTVNNDVTLDQALDGAIDAIMPFLVITFED